MEWLTREQIDNVLDNLSAGDLIEGFPRDGVQDKSGVRMPAAAFDAAALRLGVVTEGKAVDRIRAADFRYLAERIGEVINVDSPLSDATSELLDSPEPGVEDSDPQTYDGSP